MTELKLHKCVRCGIDVYKWGSACKDCNAVDPTTVRLLRPPPRETVEVERPPDCPEPTAGARERHRSRGELSCRACLEYAYARRKPRNRKRAS